MKKQRKDAADTKAAKTAATKLAERRKQFSRSTAEYPETESKMEFSSPGSNLKQYGEDYKKAVHELGATPVGSSILGKIGEKFQPVDATYKRSGETDLTALLRQKGVEANSLRERKNIIEGLRLKYPSASEKELVEILKKALNK